MPEGGIEDAALAVHLGERDSEIAVRAMDAVVAIVDELGFVETEQHVDVFARPVLQLIDFIALEEGFGEMLCGGKVGVFQHDRRLEGAPGVLVEPSAVELRPVVPFVVAVGRGVYTDEALPIVTNEGEQVGLLIVAEIELAGAAIEDDGIEGGQRFALLPIFSW